MKSLLLALALAALVLPEAHGLVAITIRGQASRQLLDEEDQSIETVPITTSRLYKEYGLSRRDYALVMNENFNNMLMFTARFDSNLPPVYILVDHANEPTIYQHRNGSLKADGLFVRTLNQVLPSIRTNYFTEFRGTARGRIRYHNYLRQVEVEVLGSSVSHILKFKIRSQGKPVPQLNP